MFHPPAKSQAFRLLRRATRPGQFRHCDRVGPQVSPERTYSLQAVLVLRPSTQVSSLPGRPSCSQRVPFQSEPSAACRCSSAVLRLLCSCPAASSVPENLVVRPTKRVRPLRTPQGRPVRSPAVSDNPAAHTGGSLLLFLWALTALIGAQSVSLIPLIRRQTPLPGHGSPLHGRPHGGPRGTDHCVRTLLLAIFLSWTSASPPSV
ncbi:hypothetical protein NDU88_004863 [Pleurodeles waltl]|uniref:Uncharacterized protein n=1 Tax=Pleurodeles waltl TaxID=8319 RepID=A0AAV7UGX8_PLEWA|nr:hypothetical protein NDU88_004863 [Pleurodeles waltl]